MTDFIQEYLNSRNRRQYGSNATIQSGPDGNTLSMGTFPGDIFGQNVEMTNQTPEQMQQNITASQENTDLGNVFVGGAVDAIQGAGETISELGNFVGLKIPPPRLPEVDKPEGTINNIARGFTQFGVGMLASPVKGFSLGKNIIRGAFSDSYFDPEEGGFITLIREMGGPEILEVLDTRVGEDATAIERLQGRLGNAVEGAVLGGIVDTLRYIKQTPHLLQKARETIVQAGQKIGTDAQARLDANKGSTSLSAMGVAEVESAIDTQLAKLAPTNNVLDDTKTVLDARAEQMQLNPADRVQPSGQDPLFDTSPQSYEQTKVEQKEIVLPRNNGEVATLPIRDRARAVLDNTDAIAQEIANSIKPAIGSNVQYFYHTAPLIDKAVALGIPEELAKKQLFKFAQNYAVTSPRTTTDMNLRNASLVGAKETLNKDITEILGPGGEGINEKGYPMMIGEGGIHRQLINDKQAENLNVNTNPKPVSFAENVNGNLKPVTVDTHAIRAVFYVMNKLNPGSVPVDFIGGKTPKKTKEFQEMYKNDPSSLDVATMIKDTLSKQMIDGQSKQTEYAVFADIYKKVAELAGVNPAEAQSLTWFSYGNLTGLASEPKTIVELIDDRVDVTSQLTGQSKDEIFKKFMQGGLPLASLGGLSLLDTGAEINLDEEKMVE